jgi:hypothetical protein
MIGPPNEKSLASAFPRNRLFAALLALTTYLVVVPVSIFFFSRAISTGVVIRDFRDIAAWAIFFGVLWGITTVVTIAFFQEQRFNLRPEGFIPPHRPFVHVLRRQRIVSFDDVVVLRFETHPFGRYATLRLRDGHIVELKEWDGVPREAFETLSHRCGSVIASP